MAEGGCTSTKGVSDAEFENKRLLHNEDDITVKSERSDTTNIQKNLEDDERETKINTGNVKKQRREIIPQIEKIEQNLTGHIKELEKDESLYRKPEYTSVKKQLKSNLSGLREVKKEIEQGRMFKEINVKISELRENQCHISGICQLPDGTIILADNNNKRIKRMDADYNINKTDYLDVEDYPRGICCTGDTEVAVKLSNNRVQFISVGSSLSHLRDRDISVLAGGGYYGIAYCAEKLWISTGRGVDVYDKQGILINTISKADKQGKLINTISKTGKTDDENEEKHIFKSYTQHMAVCEEGVIVTDYSDGAVCLSKDGKVIRELRNNALSVTRGICVSEDETVFIVGSTSKNIVAFPKDEECSEYLNKKGCLKDINPVSMCYDKSEKCLLVGSIGWDKILKLTTSS